MSYDDPKTVADQIVSLDGHYSERADVFINARDGGYGSTSASCWIELVDADTSARRRYLVQISMDEDEDE